MKGCLDERALMRAWSGLGRPAEAEHLRSCFCCRARLKSIGEEAATLAEALREPSPVRVRSRTLEWQPAFAAAALVLLAAVGVAVNPRSGSAPDSGVRHRRDESLEALRRLSAALYGFDRSERAAFLPVRPGPAGAVEAALRGSAPDEDPSCVSCFPSNSTRAAARPLRKGDPS